MLQQFHDGDTRVIGGVTYVRQGGRWVPQAGAAQQPASLPRVIEGPAREPPPVRPIQERTDQLSAEDLRSRVATNPDEEREATARRRIAEAQATEAERRAADPTGALGIEQSRAAGFYSRGRDANSAYEALGVGAPPAIQTFGRSLLPEQYESYIMPEARERAEANIRAFIASVLRYESGAAIPPEEFSSAYRTYFPQTGEEPGTTAEKARLRAEALDALRIGAGPALSQVRENGAPPAAMTGAGARGRAEEGLVVDVVGGRPPASLEEASPEFTAAFAAAKRENPSLTFQQFIAQYRSSAEPPPPAPSAGQQLWDATTNTAAGVAQGMAAIPDAAINATGAILGTATDIIPGVPEWVSDELRTPYTIGGAIESLAPTPDDTTGQGVRLASQFMGGAASLPRRATTHITNALVGRVPPPPPRPNALAPRPRDVGAAAARLQQYTGTPVRMLPADVGGPAARFVSGAASRSLGGIPMARGAEASIGSVATARNAIAGRIGAHSDEAGAGRAARRGIEGFIADQSQATRLYNRIPIPDDAHAQLLNTYTALGNLTNPLRSNPALTELVADPRFSAWRQALAPSPSGPGGLSWHDLKEFRTMIGRRISSGADEGGELRHLYGALTADMEATATANGPRALQAFRRANNYFRARQTRIDRVLQPLLGTRRERSGEQLYQELNRMAQVRGGNSRDLGRVLRSMPADERGEVAATLVSRMGMVRPETPGALGEVFSPAVFGRQWGQLSERARATLFPERRLRGALNDLAIVTNGMTRAQQFVNFSNSATTANVLALLGIGSVGDFGASAAIGAGQYGLGMFMARDVMRSPRYVRWLAQAGRIAQTGNEQALRQHVVRLGAIAEGNPSLQQLQERLAAAFSASPATRAAAEQN